MILIINEMTKYYKLFKAYYKVQKNKTEKVSAYKHYFGIECNLPSVFSLDSVFSLEEAEEVTELQFNRIKKIVLAKLLKD